LGPQRQPPRRSLVTAGRASFLAAGGSLGSILRARLRRLRGLRGVSGCRAQEGAGQRSRAVLPGSFRFAPEDDQSWLPCLQSHGVVVLQKALQESEVDEAQELIWQWLEGFGSSSEGLAVCRRDAATWTMGDGRWPQDNDATGIVCVRGAGQCLAAWRVRGAETVQRAFAKIWEVEVEQLLTSMDGLILWRPWQQKPSAVSEAWKTRESWLHVDQNVSKRPGLESVQGLVTLTGAHPEHTGGFVCVPG
ncbi:unnamed protein product, partial [Polarella glacialis]